MDEVFTQDPVELFADHLPVHLQVSAHHEQAFVLATGQPPPFFNPLVLRGMQVLNKVDDSDGQRQHSLHGLRVPGPILQVDEAGLEGKLLNIQQKHMSDIVMEGESLADLAFLLDTVALGYLVYVLNLKGRVGVVSEEDLYADLGVYLLEDVAG